MKKTAVALIFALVVSLAGGAAYPAAAQTESLRFLGVEQVPGTGTGGEPAPGGSSTAPYEETPVSSEGGEAAPEETVSVSGPSEEPAPPKEAEASPATPADETALPPEETEGQAEEDKADDEAGAGEEELATAQAGGTINIANPGDWRALAPTGTLSITGDTEIFITTPELDAGVGVAQGYTQITVLSGAKLTIHGAPSAVYKNLILFSPSANATELTLDNLRINNGGLNQTAIRYVGDVKVNVLADSQLAALRSTLQVNGSLTFTGGSLSAANTEDSSYPAVMVEGKLRVEGGLLQAGANDATGMSANDIYVAAGASLVVTADADNNGRSRTALNSPAVQNMVINNDGQMQVTNHTSVTSIGSGGQLTYAGSGTLKTGAINTKDLVMNSGSIEIAYDNPLNYALRATASAALNSGSMKITCNKPISVGANTGGADTLILKDTVLTLAGTAGRDVYLRQSPANGSWQLENANFSAIGGQQCNAADAIVKINVHANNTAVIRRSPVRLEVDRASVVFPDKVFGYSPFAPVPVTLSNTGAVDIDDLTVQLGGAAVSVFELTQVAKTSLAEGENTSFTVKPRDNLYVYQHSSPTNLATYTADVIVKSGGVQLYLLPISFKVLPSPTAAFGVDSYAPKDFGTVDIGYAVGSVPAQTVKLYNCAQDTPLDDVTARLSGGAGSNFVLTPAQANPYTNLFKYTTALSYAVQPKDGLAPGVYREQLILSTLNATVPDISIDLKFVVLGRQRLGLFELPDDYEVVFAAEYQLHQTHRNTWRYVSLTATGPETVTGIKVTGNTNPTAFETDWYESQSYPEGGSVEPGLSYEIMIRPQSNLPAGVHTAVITAGGAGGATVSVPVRYEVKATPTYGCDITNARRGYFATVEEGYLTQEEMSFVVKNIGTATFLYPRANIIGPNADAFELTQVFAANSVNVNHSDTLKIRPVADLAPGKYNAQLKVTGDFAEDALYDISLTVNALPRGVLEFTTRSGQVFPGAVEDYPSVAPISVTVVNRGTLPVTGITQDFVGLNYPNFVCSALPQTTLAPKESMTLAVRPAMGLTALSGSSTDYSASLRLMGDGGTLCTLPFTFLVSKASYSIALDKTGVLQLPLTYLNQTDPPAAAVEITNTGTGKAKDLLVSVADTAKFEVGQPEYSTLYPGGKVAFTVRLKTGLPVGEHTSRITASGQNGLVQELDVKAVVGYLMTARTGNTALGTVAGGGTYTPGANVTVTATPQSECYFVRWLENGAQVSTSAGYTFAAAGARTLTAEFAKLEAPVANVSATGYGSTEIGWGAVAGASGYIVYRSTAAGGSYDLVKTVVGATNCTDTALACGTTYYYKVCAYRVVDGANVFSAHSAAASATPALAAATAAATSSGYNKVTLAWTAVPGASGYVIYRATGTGAFAAVKTVDGGVATGFTNTGLTAGKTYLYKVRAFRTEGGARVYGADSPAVSAKPVPAPPKSVKAGAGTGMIKLSWGKVSGATGYVIYRSTSKTGTYKKVKMLSGSTVRSYTDTNRTSGKNYYYKVRAYRTVSGKKVYGGYSAAVKKRAL